jgi:hypothetical protein
MLLFCSITVAFAAGGAGVTSFDFPGAISTECGGINAAGDIVGRYVSPDGKLHNYLLRKGEFTSIDFPGDVDFTDVAWINSRGQIVGTYGFVDGKVLAYVLTAGSFTSIEYPGAQITTGYGISDAGDIVGVDIAGWNTAWLPAESWQFHSD